MSKGLGRMERTILAELPSDEMGEPVSYVAWRVARRLGWGIWTLDSHMAMLSRQTWGEE